ncbi:unnamed protein product [Phyllotreta striolata]|uniref:Mitochondrial inner membrane protein Mpv17 n=1 Tax=Phyllotreta striolata TaxID=444603 RepID=A0A9N9TPR8_PHYSR|nr:unnamed protein product [Phyllotreta striolata]
MTGIPKSFKSFIKTNLIVVQSLQAGSLMALGDVIAQFAIERKKQYDVMRTLRFGALGVGLVGPSVAMWYKFLSKMIRPDDKTAAFKKVALDQFMFAPCFLPVFLIALNTLKGNDWQTTKAEIKDKYFDIMITNYQVWPLVQFINFKFMPLQYQVLMNQSVGLFWNSYLSWKTQLSKKIIK